MRIALVICFILFAHLLTAQNKNTQFYDSAGVLTTWENHWANVVTGRYKSVYNKKENKKTLQRTTADEFIKELNKTEKRITNSAEAGKILPDFSLHDIQGKNLSNADVVGKVAVLNFWFIGCGPCEMERASLNELRNRYAENQEVVFLSFARNDAVAVSEFLKTHSITYTVIPTETEDIKNIFGISNYPVNIVVGKSGSYIFSGSGSGIGIQTILDQYIQKALRP